MEDARLDQFDRKILALLQGDARLTNNDLSERVNLSASQCSRRRQRLEEDGYIRGYRAVLDRRPLGFSPVDGIGVTVATPRQQRNAQPLTGEHASAAPHVTVSCRPRQRATADA